MRLWVAIGLAVGVAAVSMAAQAASAPPNVKGTLMRGPITPVCLEGKACDAPAGGVDLFFSRDGEVVRRVTTGRAGRFELRLRPGAYVVRSRPSSAPGTALAPTRFRVPRAGAVVLRLHIDTGIR